MAKKIQMPSKVRLMSHPEYNIVCRVFAGTIPYRVRIFITDAAGEDGRPFTIPTSLLPTILGMTEGAFFGGVPGALGGAAGGYIGSFINLAYLINAGDAYDSLTGKDRDTLVHETTHVWQGKNSTFALSYVFNSVYNQCVLRNAYAYTPNQPWKSYNVEQQASIVEDWYMAGESTSSNLYHYITDNVRKGDA
jgi:hypothetical protein